MRAKSRLSCLWAVGWAWPIFDFGIFVTRFSDKGRIALVCVRTVKSL